MNAGLTGRKRFRRSCDFHIWKVLGGGGALRGLKRLTYDSVMYFYFRYPLPMGFARQGLWVMGYCGLMGYGLQIPAYQLGGTK